MELKGISLSFLHTAPEDTEAFNRWYDLDHLAEHISKPDVLTARRYVAPRDLQQADGILAGEASGGYQPYVTMYLFGVENFSDPEVLAGWATKDRALTKSGRRWLGGGVAATGRWRLAQAVTRASLYVSEAAVPYVAHRGIIAALGRPPTPDHADAAVRWWRETHLPDLLAVHGILAALRFTPADERSAGMLLHLLLLEDDPAEVMPRIGRALRFSAALGRYPAFGGVYEPLAFLPYRTIIPLQHDFEW